MLRIAATVAALAVGATVVYAQSAAIGQRQQVMKAIGGAMKEPGAMMKGEKPFDLAAVQASLKTIADNSPKAKVLFPADSKTGGDTGALPAVWEKNADFLARFDKMTADATAAVAAVKDEASFKTEWPKIGANCGGCHKEYKKPAQ
jgi:cytochrome c556